MKLSIENVRLTLGSQSFHYDTQIDGTIFGIFGISGSGKSTLMKLLCGTERPGSGKIVFNEQIFVNTADNTFIPPHKRNVGVVFQEHFLFPHLNIEKNLRFGMAYAAEKQISFGSVVALLELAPLLQKKPHQLSGGERQRVAIGRALLQQPKMLLLDEPFSNLDRNKRKEIISYLLKINHLFEIPLLIISHDLEDILKLTQRLVIVSQQKIQASGDYLDILERGVAPELISPKRFLNTMELSHLKYVPKERLNYFGIAPQREPLLVTNTNRFTDKSTHLKRVKLSIAPDDIALSNQPCPGISVQNQVKGVVSKIFHINDSFYVTLDCGVSLIAEITPRALYSLNIQLDREIYCLFKAKAVEVIHIFGVENENDTT